jgi:methylmalonyl-CoA/ethylmalonyl-CoA epimerase
VGSIIPLKKYFIMMKKKQSFFHRAFYLFALIVIHTGCGNPTSDSTLTSAEDWQLFESPVIQNKRMAQVAVIVKDIEKSAELYASMFGINTPGVIVAAGHESRPTLYRGKPSNATAKLAFIELDNIQIELIEPDGTPSIWQEFADSYGQGMQHIAFWVDDIDKAEQTFISAGMEVLQSGGWDGGAYSYIDATEQMGTIIELLHNYQ